MTTPANPIGEQTTGVVGFTGTGFTSSPVTQYAVQIGGSNPYELDDVSGLGTSGQILTSNGAGMAPTWQDAPGGGIGGTLITKFTANGTWTKATSPSPIQVRVLAWGGGAGGGSGRKGAAGSRRCGGSGGGGGQFINILCDASTFSATETVTIGATAAGGASQSSSGSNGNAGTTGNNTSIGSIVIAIGGVAGARGENNGTAAASASRELVSNFRQSSSLGTSTSIPGASGRGSSELGEDAIDGALYSGATGGGGGGGIETNNVDSDGGWGGHQTNFTGSTQIAGGTDGQDGGGDGGNGNPFSDNYFLFGATGGGGGGGASGTDGGDGGNGGTPGGGGGGSGAATNTSGNSGTGGTGARGELWVIEYF